MNRITGRLDVRLAAEIELIIASSCVKQVALQ